MYIALRVYEMQNQHEHGLHIQLTRLMHPSVQLHGNIKMYTLLVIDPDNVWHKVWHRKINSPSKVSLAQSTMYTLSKNKSQLNLLAGRFNFSIRGLPSVKQKVPYPGRGMYQAVSYGRLDSHFGSEALGNHTLLLQVLIAAFLYGDPSFLGKTEKSLDFVYPCFAAGYFYKDDEMEGCDWF